MGVVKELALLPLAPLRFTLWVADRVAEQVEREHTSPQALVRRLQEIERARASGEIDDGQAAELEALVLEQSRGLGGW
jgi:hypothetical protein